MDPPDCWRRRIVEGEVFFENDESKYSSSTKKKPCFRVWWSKWFCNTLLVTAEREKKPLLIVSNVTYTVTRLCLFFQNLHFFKNISIYLRKISSKSIFEKYLRKEFRGFVFQLFFFYFPLQFLILFLHKPTV